MKKFLLSLIAMVAAITVNAQVISFTEAASAGSLNGKTLGTGFTLTVTDTQSKVAVDASNCLFGTAVNDTVSFDYRMKTGGKSSANNQLTLVVPSDGILKIYARTGSNYATDRNFVVANAAGDTIINHTCVEANDTISDPAWGKNTYKPVTADVTAGTYTITYPVGSINIYGFELVTAQPEPTPAPKFAISSSEFTATGGKLTFNDNVDFVNAEKVTCNVSKAETSDTVTTATLALDDDKYNVINVTFADEITESGNYTLDIPDGMIKSTSEKPLASVKVAFSVTAQPEPTPSTAVTTTEALQAAVNAGGDVQLGDDIDLTATIYVPENTTVTLNLNGHVLNAGNIPTPTNEGDKACVIYNGGTLNIIDSNPTATHTQEGLTGITGGVLTGGKGFVMSTLTFGGAIVNIDTLSVTGTTITGNTVYAGGGILNYGGTITLSGVTISGNTVTAHSGGIYNYGSLTLDGKNNISGNTLTDGTTSNIASLSPFTLGDNFDKTSTIGVSTFGQSDQFAAAQFTTNGTADDVAAFTSDDSNYEVAYNEGGYLETVAKKPTPASTVCKIGDTEYNSVQEAIDAVTTAGQTIQLTGDIDLTATITVKTTTPAFTLDLNGHVLNAGNLAAPTKVGDKANVIYNEGTLTIKDSNPTAVHSGSYSTLPVGGVLTGGKGCIDDKWKLQQGGAIFNNKATLNIGTTAVSGGTYTGNKVDRGGAIYNNEGTVTTYNCQIIGNEANQDGGAICNFGVLNLYDGTEVMNNVSKNTYLAGGIYSWWENTSPATVNISGKVVITDNTTTLNGEGSALNANLCLSGYNESGRPFTPMTISNLKDSTSIGVTTENNDVEGAYQFTSNGSANDAQYFFADDANRFVKQFNTDHLELALPVTLKEDTTTYHEDGRWEAAQIYNITVNRAMNAGKWNTLMLTFPMTAEEVAANFGTDAKVMKLTGVTDYAVNFETATAIDAYEPYIVKQTSNVTTFSVTGKTGLEDQVTNGSFTKSFGFWEVFSPFYKTTCTAADNKYILNDNKFYLATNDVNVKGYRWIFGLSSGVAAKPSLSISFDGEVVTGIENVDADVNVNLNGKFFKDGKLVIVKDGKLFNAAGQEIE